MPDALIIMKHNSSSRENYSQEDEFERDAEAINFYILIWRSTLAVALIGLVYILLKQ